MLYSGTGHTHARTHIHTAEEIEDIFTLGDGKGGGSQIDTWNSIIVLWSTYYKAAGLNSAREKLSYVLQHHNASAAYDAT